MNGRRALAVAAVALLSTVGLATPAGAEAVCDELSFPDGAKGSVAASLSGSKVVSSSGEVGVGDPDGSGTLLLTLQSYDKKMATIAYQFGSANVALPLEGAHIHKAPPGEIWLSGKTLFGYTDQPDRSGVIFTSKCFAHDIFQRPGDFYVDVHNYEYPDQGAIRGQLGRAN